MDLGANPLTKCSPEPLLLGGCCAEQKDDMEHILVKKMTRFLMQRAENFFILRRKPVDVSAHRRPLPAFLPRGAAPHRRTRAGSRAVPPPAPVTAFPPSHRRAQAPR